MKIEINPKSLLNLENIFEVLYKLHPYVLDELVELERNFGNILGKIDLSNLSLEEREFLSEVDSSQVSILSLEKENKNSERFHNLRKYIQLDTDEYIHMKIFVEIEDPVVGEKVRELVKALEKTRAPEQFYLGKKEMDEDAYFAEGYGLTMNEEQKKKFEDFFGSEDDERLKELLIKEKLFP